jgi:large subunit ribosomal protein L11
MPMKEMKFKIPAGKADPGPPLGTVLGPLGVPIGQIVAKMNEVTKPYEGMKMPVILKLDPVTKQFEVEVGPVPTSELLKKEAGLEKASGDGSVAGDISMDKVKEIAKQKQADMNARDFDHAVKEVLGTCKSIGLTVDGQSAKDLLKSL